VPKSVLGDEAIARAAWVSTCRPRASHVRCVRTELSAARRSGVLGATGAPLREAPLAIAEPPIGQSLGRNCSAARSRPAATTASRYTYAARDSCFNDVGSTVCHEPRSMVSTLVPGTTAASPSRVFSRCSAPQVTRAV